MARMINLACAQMGPIAKSDTRGQAVARQIELLREAKSRGAEFVVFPELAFTTFFPRWVIDDPAELNRYYETEMPGPETLPLFEEAKKAGIGFYIGYAELVFIDGVAHRFNTSIMVDASGAIIGKYRKIHLPGHKEPVAGLPAQHLEKRYFEPGNLGFPVWRTLGGIVGMCICNDRRWPETYRMMALQGAELICIGYNTPDNHTGVFDFDQLTGFHHQLSLQAGAYQNATWVAAAAKAGCEEGTNMIGLSMIVAPSGQIVAMASSTGDELITARCDLDLGTLYKRTIFDFGRHREPSQYGLIVERKGVIEPPL